MVSPAEVADVAVVGVEVVEADCRVLTLADSRLRGGFILSFFNLSILLACLPGVYAGKQKQVQW